MASDKSSALPDDIREAVAIGNVKSVAEQTSMLANLTYGNTASNTNLSQQNAVSNQQSLSQVGLSVTGKVVNLVTNLDPVEANAINKLDTGNDVAEELADLKAEIKSMKRRS